MTIEEIQKSLLVYFFKQDLIDVIREYQVFIIEGEIGLGKTIQIFQFLYYVVSVDFFQFQNYVVLVIFMVKIC